MTRYWSSSTCTSSTKPWPTSTCSSDWSGSACRRCGFRSSGSALDRWSALAAASGVSFPQLIPQCLRPWCICVCLGVLKSVEVKRGS